MRKILILTFVLVLILSVDISAKKWEFFGGLSYNSYNLDDINDDAKTARVDEEESGFSINGGIKRKFTENIKLGIEGEYLFVEWDSNDNFKANSKGLLGSVTYILPVKSKWNFSLYGAAGIYFTSLESNDHEDDDSDMGYKAGLHISSNVSEDIISTCVINYRHSNVKVEDIDVDFSGFEVGFTVAKKF